MDWLKIKDQRLRIFCSKIMFAKQNRLAKDRDVQTAYRAGRTFFTPQFTIKFLKTREVTLPSRFTVVVSTKVAKQAVKRNRMKRIVREFLRTHLSGLLAGDYMFIVRPGASKATSNELRTALEEGLVRNKLLL